MLAYQCECHDWRHQRETFSMLLALCREDSPVIGEFPSQRPALMFPLICTWTNGWANHWDAGDLRCHNVHHDVTVMMSAFPKYFYCLYQFLIELGIHVLCTMVSEIICCRFVKLWIVAFLYLLCNFWEKNLVDVCFDYAMKTCAQSQFNPCKNDSFIVLESIAWLFLPLLRSWKGVYWFHLVRPSIGLWTELCPLCILSKYQDPFLIFRFYQPTSEGVSWFKFFCFFLITKFLAIFLNL